MNVRVRIPRDAKLETFYKNSWSEESTKGGLEHTLAKSFFYSISHFKYAHTLINSKGQRCFSIHSLDMQKYEGHQPCICMTWICMTWKTIKSSYMTAVPIMVLQFYSVFSNMYKGILMRDHSSFWIHFVKMKLSGHDLSRQNTSWHTWAL